MMLEDIHTRLKEAYTEHKETFHKECPTPFEQKDGSKLCKKLDDFEKQIQTLYEGRKHDYLKGLAKEENKSFYYNSKIDLINAKFIDGKHIEDLSITTANRETGEKTTKLRTYSSDIEKEYVEVVFKGKKDLALFIDKSEEVLELLLCFAFADLRLYDFLIDNPPNEMNTVSLTKMKWKGTQKELAELFLELQNKGWIEKHESKTIKESFTPSKSIHQYLKPTKSKITDYKATYENLFGPRYKRQFDTLKENTSS